MHTTAHSCPVAITAACSASAVLPIPPPDQVHHARRAAVIAA
jgi:hypothetical protein